MSNVILAMLPSMLAAHRLHCGVRLSLRDLGSS